MAYSATLANIRGLLSDEEHKRLHNLFSKAGLSMDHHDFNEDILDKATTAILKTRDGKLRAAVPSPLGSCVFLNDVSMDEMYAALRKHKEIMKNYPRNGEGLEAFVDSSDTGYTMNGIAAEFTKNKTNGGSKTKVINDDVSNGTQVNGANGVNGSHATNGTNGTKTNGVAAANKHATAPEGVDGMQNGNANTSVTNGTH